MFPVEWKYLSCFALCLLNFSYSLNDSAKTFQRVLPDNAEKNRNSSAQEATFIFDSVCVYPQNSFRHIIRWECPAMTSSCIIDIPFDTPLVFERIRCSTADYQANNSLEVLSAAQMIKQIEFFLRSQGLQQCILSAFYARNCYFSAQMTPHLNALPRMFPRLKVVAVDASEHSKCVSFSHLTLQKYVVNNIAAAVCGALSGSTVALGCFEDRLYTRYGVVGTPTVILWVDGMPISRMNEAPFSLESFRTFIENRTDLEGIRSVKVSESDRKGPLVCEYEAPAVDWLFLLAVGSMILSIFYFIIISSYAKTLFVTLRRRLGLVQPL